MPRECRDLLTGQPIPPRSGPGRPACYAREDSRRLEARLIEVEALLGRLIDGVEWEPIKLAALRRRFWALANALNGARLEGGQGRPAPGRPLRGRKARR